MAAAVSASAKPRTPKFVEPYIPTGFAVDDQTTVTQYLGNYNVTHVTAKRVNELPKPFRNPEESDLDLTYVKIVDPAYVPLMWQQAQAEAEKESQAQSDSGRTFIGKETLSGGGAIYWYQEDSLRYLPRRLRAAAGDTPSLTIYDATIIQKFDRDVLKVKITDLVGDRDIVRQCFKQ